jgi:hypothetical protein
MGIARVTRHWRYRCLSAGAIAALTAVLASCEGAHSQSPEPVVVTNTNLPVTLTNPVTPLVITGTSGGYTVSTVTSSPLPESSGVYRFDSFYYNCSSAVVNIALEVAAGPDMGLVIPLPANGGGLVKFWLRPVDQVQITWTGTSACTTYLYGEALTGSLQTLQ